jgi:hypothetical protein
VVGEVVVALNDGSPPRRMCDWLSGSYSGECGGRLERYVAVAEGVPVIAACDGRVKVSSCQGWPLVAGNIARVRVPHVLDRKRAGAHSSRWSSC